MKTINFLLRLNKDFKMPTLIHLKYTELGTNVWNCKAFHDLNKSVFEKSDKLCFLTLSASRDRKPKWDKNRRAVWNSCEGGGGLHSVWGSGKCFAFQISSLCRSKAFSYSICLVIRIRSLSCCISSCKEREQHSRCYNCQQMEDICTITMHLQQWNAV